MKIIHVAQFLGIGGLEKIIYHLAHEQQKRGHCVEIYIYDYERTWVDFFRKSGLTVITPELKKAGIDLGLFKRMNRDLFMADVIHSHDLNPLVYLGPLSTWKKLTFQKKPRLIHTTHGLDHLKTSVNGKMFQRVFSRMADKIVGVSDKIGKFYLDDIKLSTNRVEVIQNGIETIKDPIDPHERRKKKEWVAMRHGLDVNRPIILSLSRVVPLKDQKFLVKALKKRPECQLVIAGPPSDQVYYDELKLMEDRNIKLVGPQELVLDYNTGSDMYVSASTHEGIPVAVLEAMTVESPCLVSKIPGHLTLLQHGSFVEIFELGDEDDFLKKFDHMMANTDVTKHKAILGRELVEKYYSLKIMADKYFKVYEA